MYSYAAVDGTMADPEIGQVARLYAPTGMSPVRYVIQLLTPLFQRSVAIGYKSPKPVTESLMLPCLVAVSGPTLAVSVPFRSVLLRPQFHHAECKLATEYRRCERVARIDQS